MFTEEAGTILLIMKTEKNFNQEKVLQFTQICNF